MDLDDGGKHRRTRWACPTHNIFIFDQMRIEAAVVVEMHAKSILIFHASFRKIFHHRRLLHRSGLRYPKWHCICNYTSSKPSHMQDFIQRIKLPSPISNMPEHKQYSCKVQAVNEQISLPHRERTLYHTIWRMNRIITSMMFELSGQTSTSMANLWTNEWNIQLLPKWKTLLSLGIRYRKCLECLLINWPGHSMIISMSICNWSRNVDRRSVDMYNI